MDTGYQISLWKVLPLGLTFLFDFVVILDDKPFVLSLPRLFSLLGSLREPGFGVKVFRVCKKSKYLYSTYSPHLTRSSIISILFHISLSPPITVYHSPQASSDITLRIPILVTSDPATPHGYHVNCIVVTWSK